MKKDAILGIIRHLLTAGGGALVAYGVTDAGGAADIVGAIMTLAGLVWSVIDKQQRAEAPVADK